MITEKQVRRLIGTFWLGILSLFILATITMFCFGTYGLFHLMQYGKPPQLTHAEEIFLTSDLTKPISARNYLPTFDTRSTKIYCIISLQTVFGLRSFGTDVTIHWYYNGVQIAGQAIMADSWGKIIVWLEPPKNQPFRSGRYSVKIVIDQYFVQTVNFEIK